MNIDLAVKGLAAIAGLICGLAQVYTNGKTLVKMATTDENAEQSESSSSQIEEV